MIAGGRRASNGQIGLRVPTDVIKAKCARYMRGGKPADRPELMNEEDQAIISRYGSEYRGIIQYYLLAADEGSYVKFPPGEEGGAWPPIAVKDAAARLAALGPVGPSLTARRPRTVMRPGGIARGVGRAGRGSCDGGRRWRGVA